MLKLDEAAMSTPGGGRESLAEVYLGCLAPGVITLAEDMSATCYDTSLLSLQGTTGTGRVAVILPVPHDTSSSCHSSYLSFRADCTYKSFLRTGSRLK